MLLSLDMGEPGERKGQAPSMAYDPATLLSLYNMSAGLYGGGVGGAGFSGLPASTATPTPHTTTPTTLGLAASQAQSLGLNPSSAVWWSMNSQLAAQEYLSRIQAAARDPSAYASLMAQGVLPSYELLTQGSKARKEPVTPPTSSPLFHSLKLPSDTEIVRRPAGSESSGSSNSFRSSLPSLPPGLTIEKKKPGRKPLDPNYHVPSSGQLIDRVEITKIPASNGALDMRRGGAKKEKEGEEEDDAPLNLSIRSGSADSAAGSTSLERSTPTSRSSADYYASHALSGVFLAEQIRQQQLASQLQNHLQVPGGLTAMQALLSLSKLQAENSCQDGKKTE